MLLLFWKLCLYDPAKQLGPQSGDLYDQIYPMWMRAGELMRSGHLPLWNPYQGCGHPFAAAVLYGIFYPLNFFRFLLPAQVAMEATLLLHIALAWGFTFWFACSGLRLSTLGSFLAATTFALGGFLVGDSVWFTPAAGAAIWPPLAFLAVEKLFRERRVVWLSVLAVAVAMPILAGWVQTWMHMMHALILYFVVRAMCEAREPAQRRAILQVSLFMVLGIVLGVGLAAVQLLPSMELQRLGWRRPGGLSLEQQLTYGVFSPWDLYGQAVDPSPGWPRPIYLGIAALVLAPLSLLTTEQRRQTLALWVVACWSVAVALSVGTPLFWIYRALPGGTTFRVPLRMLYFYTFACAALVGIACDAVGRAESRVQRTGLSGLGIGAVGLLLVCGMPLRAAVYASFALAFILLALWVSTVRVAATIALGILLVFDLFGATEVRAIRPVRDLSFFASQQGVLEYVRAHQDLGRTYVHEAWPYPPALSAKQATMRGVYAISDYEVLSLARYGKYCRAMNGGAKFPGSDTDFVGVCLLRPGDVNHLAMLDRLGVRFVVKRQDLGPGLWLQRAGWSNVFAADGYVVYQNPDPLPRAFVAYDHIDVADEAEAFRLVTRPAERPRGSIVIESDRALPRDQSVRPGQAITPARITSYEANRVAIEVDATESGYVVLTDSFYPGWRAYVDGKGVPILRTNYLFRSVAVEAGHHAIVFAFVPLTVWGGAVLSALSLTTLLLILSRRGRLDEWMAT